MGNTKFRFYEEFPEPINTRLNEIISLKEKNSKINFVENILQPKIAIILFYLEKLSMPSFGCGHGLICEIQFA